jgi:hypothetical protein
MNVLNYQLITRELEFADSASHSGGREDSTTRAREAFIGAYDQMPSNLREQQRRYWIP